MTIAIDRLAALGHETRLAIFRLLVQAGPDGVNAGAIGETLDLAPATLSFHLAHLNRVGLITGRQESRFIYYAADYIAMNDLIAYLTDNCCSGEVCLDSPASHNTVVCDPKVVANNKAADVATKKRLKTGSRKLKS